MIGSISDLLLALSNALLVPAVVLLLGLCVFTVMHAGGVIGELWSRRRRGAELRALVARMKQGEPGVDAAALRDLSASGLIGRALHAPAAARDKVLEDVELLAERRLARLQMGVRLGPMLGLAGTLIPLGPALVGLSTGDLEALSQNLVVAFATTVLGLFAGGVCFVMHAVRRAWYEQDLSDLAFLLRSAP